MGEIDWWEAGPDVSADNYFCALIDAGATTTKGLYQAVKEAPDNEQLMAVVEDGLGRHLQLIV